MAAKHTPQFKAKIALIMDEVQDRLDHAKDGHEMLSAIEDILTHHLIDMTAKALQFGRANLMESLYRPTAN